MRLNVETVAGGCLFVFGALIVGVEFGGMESSTLFGTVLVGPILVVLGVVLVSLGSRPKRFSKHHH